MKHNFLTLTYDALVFKLWLIIEHLSYSYFMQNNFSACRNSSWISFTWPHVVWTLEKKFAKLRAEPLPSSPWLHLLQWNQTTQYTMGFAETVTSSALGSSRVLSKQKSIHWMSTYTIPHKCLSKTCPCNVVLTTFIPLPLPHCLLKTSTVSYNINITMLSSTQATIFCLEMIYLWLR